MLLSEFNTAGRRAAADVLTACAPIDHWVEAVVARRPYGSPELLLAAADETSQAWSRHDVEAALAGHPRIGEKARGKGVEAQLSASEQSGVSTDEATREALQAANERYEERFGHVFLIRAAGRSQDEILAECERRLLNDDDTEWRETTSQLREIALLRLAGQIAGEPA